MTNIILKLSDGAEVPQYAHKGDSGMDVRAMNVKALYTNLISKEDTDPDLFKKIQDNFKKIGYLVLRAGERVCFGTGLHPELPKGKEIQVRSKSGQSLKKGLTMCNGIGTIDNPYRGEIGVIIKNDTDVLNKVFYKEKIAQIVVSSIDEVNIVLKDKISETSRNENGYGSTGIK